VDDPNVDEIFVVSLNIRKHGKVDVSKCIESWKETRRKLDIFDYSGPREVRFADNVPPIIVPYREPRNNFRVIHFFPTQNLGGVWTGTLNFTPEYAKKLIRQGLAETLCQLRSLRKKGEL
jgi:hypothetical protein